MSIWNESFYALIKNQLKKDNIFDKTLIVSYSFCKHVDNVTRQDRYDVSQIPMINHCFMLKQFLFCDGQAFHIFLILITELLSFITLLSFVLLFCGEISYNV